MLGWESGGFGAAPAWPETCQAGWGSSPHHPTLPSHSLLHPFRAWSLLGKHCVCEAKGSTEHEAATLSYWVFRHQWSINKNIWTETAAVPSSPFPLRHGKHNPKHQQHLPRPKSPPKLHQPPQELALEKRALQLCQEGQQILSCVQIKAQIHLTAVVS